MNRPNNDVMVDDLEQQVQAVDAEASRFRRAAAAAGTVTKGALSHPATTHGAAAGAGAGLGFVAGLVYGKEYSLSRMGHLRRVVIGKPSGAKSLWKRVQSWF